MSKKVIKSSNKNEKYNLKSVLDTDNIMSGVSLKAVTTIGCASIIASCGGPEKGDKGNEDKTKLKWETLDNELKEKFDNNQELFKKFINKCKDFTNDDLTNLIKKLNKEEITDAIKSEENITKDENGNAKIGNKTISINEQKTKNENEKIKGLEYDKLPENIKEKLKKLDENNEGFVKEFWNTIKNEENIDKLINNDEDLKNKYEAFKTEKKNQELINEQLNKAKFDDASQSKITSYISYIDDTLKVKINNSTANQYLLGQLKEKEKQSEIVKCVESLYKQVISEGKIKTEIKKQLKTIIKTCFEKLISEDESYKGNIEIKNIDDITIEDNGKVKVKFTSKNVQNPQANEYIIEQEFFDIVEETLIYKEVKDSQENGEKSLSLMKLTYKDGKDLSNYQFENTDKTELNKLVTPKEQTPPSPIKDAYENYKKTYALKKNDPKTKDEIETEVKHLLSFTKNLVGGKDNNNKMIGNVSKINDIYKAFDNDETKGKTAFENDIRAFLKDKMGIIATKLQNSTDSSLQDEYYKNSDINANKYDLDALVNEDPNISGSVKFLTTLNTKLKEQQIVWFGDNAGNNGTKCSIKNAANKAEIDEFEIGTDFETVKSDTYKVTDNKIDGALKNVTDLFVKELGDVIKVKELLKGSVLGNDVKDIMHNLISTKYCNNDLSQISLADTDLNYDTLLNNKLTTDFKKASACKKISEVTDEDLKEYVQEAMKKVFGESADNNTLFTAVKELANKKTNYNNAQITDHGGTGAQTAAPDKKFNQATKRGISFINGDTLKDNTGDKENAQKTFAVTFGKALGQIGEALAKLQNKPDNEVPTQYKALLQVLFGTYGVISGSGEEYDFAMKDTVFLKWLTCADVANYGNAAANKKTSLNASLKVMSYLIFVDNATTFKEPDADLRTVNIGGGSAKIVSFALDTNNSLNLKLNEASKGIGGLANPEALTYHFFCTSDKGLLLDNSDTGDIKAKGGTIPVNITISSATNWGQTVNFVFVDIAKKDAKSNTVDCSNFCHIMKFFGGAENYKCVVNTNTDLSMVK